jgi:hypothetical protein
LWFGVYGLLGFSWLWICGVLMVGVFLVVGLVMAVAIALGWVADLGFGWRWRCFVDELFWVCGWVANLGFGFEGGYACGWDLILWMGY